STLFAVGAGFLPARFSLRARWLCAGSVTLAAALGYGVATDVPSVVVALSIAGLGIGPALVTLYSLAAERSPQGRSATVMTMLGSGVIVGQSAASALPGQLAEKVGTPAAMAAPAAAAGLVLVAALVNWVWSRASRRV
ncbi:MAG: MFS transporter, partial [Cellulomonadaceae bacterium]